MAPNDLGPIARNVCIAVLSLSWVAVALRYYVRLRMVKSFGLDDWFISFTLLSFSAQVGVNIAGIHYGIGKHLIDVHSLNDIQMAMKLWLVCAIIYTTTMTLLKVSICFFLLRIASKRWHRWVLYTLMAVTIIFGLFFAFFLLFECTPISNFWTLERHNCIPEHAMVKVTLVHSSIMAVGDWVCAILPIFLVWDVQMNKRMKVSVATILGIGTLGGVATIVRIIYVKKASTTTYDMLYLTGNVVIWSLIEPGMGIVAVCLATLRPLFRIALEKTVGMTNRLGSSKESRSRSQSHQLDGNSKTWPLSNENSHKMTRLQSRSTHSDSSGIAFGVVPEDYKVTTTVQGNYAEGKHEGVLSKSRVRNSRDDERPILNPPIIYKRSEITTQRNVKEMV